MFWPENRKRSFNVEQSIKPRISAIASDPSALAGNDAGGQGNSVSNEENESVECEKSENFSFPEVASTNSSFEQSKKDSIESGISFSGIYDSFSDDTTEEIIEESKDSDQPTDGEDENQPKDGEDENWMKNEVEKTKRKIFNTTDENAGDTETGQILSPTAPDYDETQPSPAVSLYYTAPTTCNVTMAEEEAERSETPQFDTTAEEMMLFAVS